MIKKPASKWGYLSLSAAVLALAFLLFSSFNAVRGLAEDLNRNHSADPSSGFKAVTAYDDGLYAVVIYGQEMLPNDPALEDHLETFERSSLEKIDGRIVSAGVIYTIFIVCALTYFAYTICNNSITIYAKFVTVSTLAVYTVYVLFAWIFHTAMKVPFYLTSRISFFSIITGILSVIGGACAAGILLMKVRFKKTIALLIVPVIFLLFLFSSALEFGLFAEEKVSSFNYVAELDSRILEDEYADQAYYDEEKDVLVFDGKEYPPEMLDNPEHLFGAARAGALLYELVFPYSGTGLPLVEQDLEVNIPLITHLMYIIKSACWTLLPIYLKKKNNEQTKK